MAYQVSVCEGYPIIQAECLTGFKMGDDMVPMLREIRAILDAARVKHHVIFDIEHAAFGVEDIIKTANIVNQPDVSILDHPMIGKQAIVTGNRIMLAALKGMNSPAFKHFAVPAFPSADKALEHMYINVLPAESTN